tara:strand:- start:497 stop:703 length:207 start_codon:yes stop_codon:yes gene_type:complete
MSDNKIVILPKAERVAQYKKWFEDAPKNVRAYLDMIEYDAQRWQIAEDQQVLSESQLEDVNKIYVEEL